MPLNGYAVRQRDPTTVNVNSTQPPYDYTAHLLNATVGKNTTQTTTLNADGTVSSVVYKNMDGATLRTDTITYYSNAVVEVRALPNGFTQTITYHLDTGNVEIQ